ncbi:MAG: LPP20 family lipoprotein, partial [Bacteroidales bacterium]
MRYLLPVFFLFLLGCAASEKAEDVEPVPGWIKNRPVMEGYHIGIGSARMVGMKQEYVAEARKNALQDMASQISAHVSSTSVLNTIENAYGVSESYSERVEIESDNYLEGFEPVDYYESENQHWVYYRIKEEVYRKNKLRKRDEALTAALSKYRSGRREAEASHPIEAITHCLQGMEALKGFLGKDLTLHSQEETIDVGNELLALLKKVISRMDITPVDKEVEVKRGSKLANPLEFRIIYNDKAVEGVPVALNYSGGYLKTSHRQSDERGHISVGLGSVISGRSRENFEAVIDHETIAAGAVSDVFIRSILKNIP